MKLFQNRRAMPEGDSKFMNITFEQLLSPSKEKRQKFAELINIINQKGGSYHRLQFADDLIIQGDYDLRKYLCLYDLPDDLTGKSVLDIGASSGFISFECARRGATVTSVDVFDFPLLEQLLPFLNANIEYIKKSIYDLNDLGKKYDIVVCGSVLLHIPDLVGAIQQIYGVCAGRAIISTACTYDSQTNERPICEFKALKAKDGDYYHYWEIGAATLVKMVEMAGFSKMTPS